MTRGAGWAWCSGILLNAGPLAEDQGVPEVANYFRAAAAPRPCCLFLRSIPWQSFGFSHSMMEAKVGRIEGIEGY